MAGPPLKTSSALGRGRGNAPLPCTPSPNQIQTSKSGSFYLAKNRNFLLGLDIGSSRLLGRSATIDGHHAAL